MKTLIAIGKVAALFSSPLLLGLYVYDRSGGNLFAPRLAPATRAPAAEMRSTSPEPGGVTVSFRREPSRDGQAVRSTHDDTERDVIVLTPAGPVDPKTVPNRDWPETSSPPMLLSGSKSFSGAMVIDAAQLQSQPPPPAQSVQPKQMMMFPGSKSLVMPSMIDSPPTPPVANAPGSPNASSFATPPPTYPSPYPTINATNAPSQQPNAPYIPQQRVQQAVPR